MPKMSKKLRERIAALELPDMWMVFYHNIEGIDFYNGELFSKERVARNINAIAFFTSEHDIRQFYTRVMLNNLVNEDDKEPLTYVQRLYHNLVQQIHDQLVVDINMDEVLKEVEENPDETFKKILDKLPQYKALKDELFDVMKEHKDPDYDIYSDLKHFSYTKDQCRLLLFAFTQMNVLFSLYAVAMNTDKNAELYIVKMKDEEILRIWELFLADFQGQMNEEAAQANFPMYQKWCEMEAEFGKSIHKRKMLWQDFIADSIARNTEKNQIDLDPSDMFSLNAPFEISKEELND